MSALSIAHPYPDEADLDHDIDVLHRPVVDAGADIAELAADFVDP